MNSSCMSRIKISSLRDNLNFQGNVYSLLIHLGILLLYLILTYSRNYSTYDLGTDTNFSSMPQKSGKKHKKVPVSEATSIPDFKKKLADGEKSPYSDAEDSIQESQEDTVDIANASDLSFYPNATAPHMMGTLKQDYPELARQMNIEAKIFVSIVINKAGKVIKVKVGGVILSQKLPADREMELKKKFAGSVVRSFKEVYFSPPSIDGKNIPIEMEQVIWYKLNL